MIISIHHVSPTGEIELVAANVPYSCLQWNRKLSTCGTFEIELACPMPVTWPSRYIVCADERSEVGILEKVDVSEGANMGAPTLSGRFAECLWDRWVSATDTAVTGANWRQAVTQALSTWHMSDIPPIVLSDGTKSKSGSSYEIALEAGKSAMSGIYDVTLDAGSRPLVTYKRDDDPEHFIVKLIDGTNRTRDQSENPICVMSLDLTTADEVAYTGDYSCACSEVLAHAEKNDGDKDVIINRTVAVSSFDSSTMWQQRAYENVTSLIDKDTTPTNALVDAKGKLRTYDHTESVSVDVSASGLGYLDAWDLGDLVEVEVKSLGLVAKERVEEVNEVWKSTGHTVSATVGTKQLTKIARALIGRR